MAAAGPYQVERIVTSKGPAYRLTGPGLDQTKPYQDEEFREKLDELAKLMNFAWNQSRQAQESR
jgi:hypothetical protein